MIDDYGSVGRLMNNSDIKTARDLIYLVSCAVNEKTPEREICEKIDLEQVYYLSSAHFLTSAVAFALEKVTVLPHPYDQAKKKAIRKLALFDIERAKLFAELEKNGIWYLPLKGILLKNDYPISAMREMSDNDILCDSSGMGKIKEIMERMGYSCDVFGTTNHDTYSKPPTLEFEIHRELFLQSDMPEIFEYFKNIREKLLPIAGTSFGYRMTDEDFYIYLICHAFKHYYFSGTGLRSLLDIYIYLSKHGEKLDRAYLDREFEVLGLLGFEREITGVAQKAFGFEELSEDEWKALFEYIESGVYGTEETRRYKRNNRNLGGDDSDGSKRRYLLKRVFISGKALESNYPFFYKHKWLYPVLFVYRPVKGLFTHPKGIIKEYREIKEFKTKRR